MTFSKFFIFTLIGFFAISGVLENDVFAEDIYFSRTLDVDKNTLQNTITNVANYEKVFPEYVKSAKLIQDYDKKTITELSMGFGIIPLSVQVEANNIDENTNELTIISGDLKGTKIVTSLEKTWAYDGTPDKGTKLNMDMSLQVSGFLAFLGIINNDLVHYSLDASLSRLVDYSKGNIPDDIKNPVTNVRKTGRN